MQQDVAAKSAQHDFGTLTVLSILLKDCLPIFDTEAINKVQALIVEGSKEIGDYEHQSHKNEPVRLLRPRPNDSGPAPPPKRFPRTLWREIVRKAIEKDRKIFRE